VPSDFPHQKAHPADIDLSAEKTEIPLHRYVTMTAILALLLFAVSSEAQSNLNTTGVRFRLERADVMRGPEAFGEDSYFNSYLVSSGSFRGFTANACSNSSGTGTANYNCTHAIDGTAAWDVGAATTSSAFHKNVIAADGTNPAWAYCGQWLNSTIVYNNTLYGFSHGEAASPNQGNTNCSTYSTHHKTMTRWTSTTGSNAGLSWSSALKVIDSTDGDSGSGESGLGDCTAIADSTYAYLFCRKPTDIATVAARAPLSSLGQSSAMFTMYDNGWGSQPGINGADSELSGYMQGTTTASYKSGSSVSQWADKGWAMFLNVEDITSGGVKTSFTAMSNLQSNSIGFSTLPAPLFVQETPGGHYPYGNQPGVNLYIYPSAVSLADGSRNWNISTSGQFLLAYTFVPPQNTLQQRILAMRSVTVTTSGTAQDPQVLADLSTRYDANLDQYYSSTQPLAEGPDYTAGTFATRYQDTLAYLPQLPASNPVSQGQNMTKIVECRNTSGWPGTGRVDHLVTSGACDSGYTEVAVAGYSYPNAPASGNGIQIYRCTVPQTLTVAATHFVTASSNCDGKGNMEKSLGWALKN
jgi:hypothetical protein